MRVEISSLVRSAGATAIYITHDQAEAFALADRVGVLEAGRLVQLGAPEEIYAMPATPFVARFTGLAAELPVRLASAPTALGNVSVVPTGLPANRPIEARWRGVAATSATGTCAIRPTAVRLCGLEGEEHHLAGVVADVAFRGRGYEHAIDLGGSVQVGGVFAEHRVPRGAPVGLRFERAGCHVFPEEPLYARPTLATARGEGEPVAAVRVGARRALDSMVDASTEVAL